MAFWRVMADLRFAATPARDAAVTALRARLGQDGRPGTAVQAHLLDGIAGLHVDANYQDDQPGVRAFLALVRAQLAGGASGAGSLHRCPHEDPPEAWYDCAGDPRAQTERA